MKTIIDSRVQTLPPGWVLPSQELWFLMKYMDLRTATGDDEARWQPFQVEHLNNQALLSIDTKSRQAGWSWISAARAVAKGKIKKRTTSVFVSINLDEAKEKIRYARHVIEALRSEVQPRFLTENTTELEFDNGSRLISHPCRPVRGKAKADVYLDEFAHYPHDKEIYISALPAMTRGGSLHIGSSPLGAGGQFWEIYEQEIQPYPGFVRGFIPWWEVAGLCENVEEARKMAPHMLTQERVEMFGSARLKMICEDMPLDDFQQEYECAWVDESVAWIPWEEIKRNQLEAQAGSLWHRSANGVDDALAAIEELAIAIKEGKVESALAGGMDVGRKRNLSELGFVGKGPTEARPLRLMISLANVEFDDQEAVVKKAVDALPLTSLLIDQNGLGMQLAENMKKVTGKAEGIDFTNANKEVWAVELKVRMQRGQVPLPLNRDLSYQIHSIKRKYTAAKNAVFDTKANEKHHADKFWMLALAVWASGQTSGAAAATADPEESQIHSERRKSAWR